MSAVQGGGHKAFFFFLITVFKTEDKTSDSKVEICHDIKTSLQITFEKNIYK